MKVYLFILLAIHINSSLAACTWKTITNSWMTSITEIGSGGYLVLNAPKESPGTLTAYFFNENGTQVSSLNLYTYSVYSEYYFTATGLPNGNVALCTKDGDSSVPKWEVRDSSLTEVLYPQSTFTGADNTYKCYDGNVVSSGAFIFGLQYTTTSVKTFYFSSSWVFNSDAVFTYNPTTSRMGTDKDGWTISGQSISAKYIPVDTLHHSSSYVPDKSYLHFFKDGSAQYENYVEYESGNVAISLYANNGGTFIYRTPIASLAGWDNYVGSASHPALFQTMVCFYYQVVYIYCRVFDALTGDFVNNAESIQIPSAPTSLKVNPLASGKYVVSMWITSTSTFYHIVLNGENSCDLTNGISNSSCLTGCTPCVNMNEWSFCGSSGCESWKFKNSNGMCQSCLANCLTCTNSTYCITCNTTYFWTGSACSLTCPTGTYEDNTNMICITCPTNCSACSSATSCSACKNGYFLSGDLCPTSCPIKFFGNTGTKACENCMNNCDTCSDSATCSLCTSTFLYTNYSCDSSCPVYSYPNATAQKCFNCSTNCTACSSYSNCSSCASSYFYYDWACTKSCPLGYYGNTSLSKCETCLENCYSCSSYGTCTLCQNGFYWTGYSCDATCPAGTAVNSTTRNCDTCRGGCTQCQHVNNCFVCLNPLTLADQTCPCPAGTRLNSSAICNSISSIIISYDFSLNASAVVLSLSLLQEETTAFPSRSYTWSVSSNSANTTLTSLLVSSFTTQTGTIAYLKYIYLEPNVQYIASCSFTNVLSLQISNSTTITNVNYLTPSLSLTSSISNLKRTLPISLTTTFGALPYSVLSGAYTFSPQDSFVIIQAQTSSNVQTSIPACYFSRNTINTLTMNYYLTQNPLFNTVLTFNLNIGADQFSLFISTLDRTHSYNLDVELSALALPDGSCPDTDITGVTYTWTCSKSTNAGSSYSACADSNGLFGVARSTSAITIPKSYYTIDNLLQITLTATKDAFTTSKTGLLNIQGDRALTLVVTCGDVPCTKYCSNTDLNLKATILNDPEVGLRLKWNISLPLSYISFNEKLFMNADTSAYLGSIIRFDVEIDDSTFSGKTALYLPINTPPSNGSLVVTPPIGDTLSTVFDIRGVNWTDSDLPLTYQHFYVSLGSNVLLSLKSATPNTSTILSGKSPSEVIQLLIYVYDSFNAPSTAQTTVVVKTPQTLFVNSLNNILEVSSSLSDPDPFIRSTQTSVIVSQLTNIENTFAELRENITSCTGCLLGESVCQYGTCLCRNSTGSLVDCSVSKADIDKIYEFKASTVNNLTSNFKDLDSNGTSSPDVIKVKQAIMNNIEVLTTNSEMIDQNVMTEVVDFFNNALDINNPNKSLSIGEASSASKILSNLMTFTTNTDCNCSKPECKSLENTTTAILEKTSQSALNGIIPGQPPYVLITPSFDLTATKVGVCDLNAVNLSASSQSPSISFSLNNSFVQDCSKAVQIQAYAFPSNLFDCSIITKKDVVMINIFDEGSKRNLNDFVNVNLKMPPGIGCPPGCPNLNGICNCLPRILDIRSQMRKIFEASNLKDLSNIAALANWDWSNSPIFWATLGACGWLVINLYMFHSFKVFKDYCLVQITKEKTVTHSKGFLAMFLVISDFTAIYFLDTDVLSKSVRTLLFYLKLIFYSTYAAIFANPAGDQSLLALLENLNLAVILLPYLTVIPLNKLVRHVVIKQVKRQRSKGKCSFIKNSLSLIFVISITCGCIIAMFIIAANKSTEAQLPWLVTFMYTIIQEAIFNPFILVFVNFFLIKYKKTKLLNRKLAKKHLSRILDENVETIYVSMKSMKPKNLAQIYPSEPSFKTLRPSSPDRSMNKVAPSKSMKNATMVLSTTGVFSTPSDANLNVNNLDCNSSRDDLPLKKDYKRDLQSREKVTDDIETNPTPRKHVESLMIEELTSEGRLEDLIPRRDDSNKNLFSKGPLIITEEEDNIIEDLEQ